MALGNMVLQVDSGVPDYIASKVISESIVSDINLLKISPVAETEIWDYSSKNTKMEFLDTGVRQFTINTADNSQGFIEINIPSSSIDVDSIKSDSVYVFKLLVQGNLPTKTYLYNKNNYSMVPNQVYWTTYGILFKNIKLEGTNTIRLEFNARNLSDWISFQDITLHEVRFNTDGSGLSEDDRKLLKDALDSFDGYSSLNNRVTTVEGNTNNVINEIADAREYNGVKYSNISERLDNQFNSYLVDSEIDIAGGTQQAQVDSLESLKGRIDKNKFNLLFQTDLHYDEGRQNYKLANQMLTHLNNALAFDGVTDAIVFGGDNIDGYQTDKRANIKHLEQFCTKALYTSEASDVFLLLGNHDDGSIRSNDFGGVMPKNQIINESEFKKYFLTSEKLNGEIRDEDSLYFYKDYSEKKIRLIGLNSVDVSEETDINGNILYPRQNYCGYRERQLKWLANVALQNVPNDYHTMIVTHVHLSETDKDNGNGTFEYHPNHTALIAIIDAFKDGVRTNLSNSLAGFELNFTADFSTQGPREFIGFFNGHCHKNFLTQAGTFNVYWTDLSMTRSDSDFGTTSEDSFNVISVDTTTKTVNILGYGRSDDLTFTY